MTRWYDYLSAFAFANIIWICFWVPAIGPIASYFVYEIWMSIYCKIRKDQEHGE